MSNPSPINIQILDKEYLIGCTDDEKEALLEAASHLDERMREIRDQGKVLGNERIAVITALNLANELLQMRHDAAGEQREFGAGVQRILAKIDHALEGDNASE